MVSQLAAGMVCSWCHMEELLGDSLGIEGNAVEVANIVVAESTEAQAAVMILLPCFPSSF